MATRTATTAFAAAAASASTAGPRGLRALFSTLSPNFSFPPSQPANESQRVMADPSDNLFVSGLSKRTTDEGLRDAFAKFGEVVQARVVKDRNSGYSKGFGFVKYSSIEGAAAGIAGMDGKFLDGWVIFAEYARPREYQPQRQESQPNQGYGPSYGQSYGRQ